MSDTYSVSPIGFIESPLDSRKDAPRQGYEGAPDVWLDVNEEFSDGLDGIAVGHEIILITWLHQSSRDVVKVHPRRYKNRPLTGVFATRSPDRPNPLGLHRVRVLALEGTRLRVGPLEVINGTPVVDIKPVLSRSADS